MQQTQWRFGPAIYDEAARALTVAGRNVDIERRPLTLLALLLAHAGEVVTKDEILDHVWPDRHVSEASVTTCVARLRQALEDTDHVIIKTVHGFGYRLGVPVAAEPTRRSAQTAALPALEPGQAVPGRPDFSLIRRLGAGGFGDAWLAEQGQAGVRRVFKFAGDPQGLSALRREITLGRLLTRALGKRPDLVQILDWRLDEMPAFIEIDWFPLGSLADWAAAQGGLAQVPLALRLDLVAQIADALAAIHSMAVLHKDLKPANVLMRLEAGAPGITLTDFGSSRALDATRLDAFGITRLDPALSAPDSTAGTQLYRAPELLGLGAATVQADIYAIGVILYQMTVGDFARPLSPGWELDVSDELVREDIAAAAAGDPARRLADAGLIAHRLRTLQDRHAARDAERKAASDAARIRHELDLSRARRTPLVVAVAALAFGLVISLALYDRANQAEHRASAEARRAEEVTAFVSQDVLSAANPFLAADPAIGVRALLAPAAADLDRRFAPESLDRAAIEQVIGRAYSGLSDPEHARPLLGRALVTRRAALGEADPQTLSVRLDLLDLAEHELDLAQMKAEGQAILHAGATLPPETELRARYAIVLSECQTTGNAETCAAPLAPLLDEARRRLGPDADITLKIASERAFALSDAEHTDEAVKLARETVARTQARFGAAHPRTLEARFLLAETLSEPTQADEAVALLTAVRQGYLDISGHETHASIRAANQLARALFGAHRFAEALPLFRMVVDRDMAERGERFSETLNALNNLANTLDALGQHAEAIAAGQRVLDLQVRATSADHPDTLWFENNLALFYEHAGDLASAEIRYRDAFERASRTQKPSSWDAGHFAYHLGVVLTQEGKIAQARIVLTDSLARLTTALGPEHARTRKTMAALQALPK